MHLLAGNTVTRAQSPSQNTEADSAALYASLSYVVENHEIINRHIAAKVRRPIPEWDGVKSFYNRRYGYFLTGFLQRVIDSMMEKGIPVVVVDRRSRPSIWLPDSDLSLHGITLRDYQVNAVTGFLRHKIVGLDMPRGVLKAGTGSGKTEMGASMIRKLGVPNNPANARAHHGKMLMECR